MSWKPNASDLSRRVFHRKRAFSTDQSYKEDWTEDFHLITREDIDLHPLPGTHPIPFIFNGDRTTARAPTAADHVVLPFDRSFGQASVEFPKSTAAPTPILPPLVIPDSPTNRISTYTARSYTTSEDSPTPTFTDFAHITASFPQPPSHIPIAPNTPGELLVSFTTCVSYLSFI